MAASVFYVLFFSLASLLPGKSSKAHSSTTPYSTFLVIYPAYNEDAVIRNSVETFLNQDYPKDHYLLTVVSDHQTDDTNQWLAKQPINLLIPHFGKSSKARALQHAIHNSPTPQLPNSPTPHTFTHVVILDADNVVAPDYLSLLNAECLAGHRAIQCHRTAKNTDSDIAVLDGLSEEINNSIFRRGHNRVGLSSALIGSGICTDYQWFAAHVDRLSTAGEDKELEAMLLDEGIHIHYAEHIVVKDEKVSGDDNFQRQRLRWMTAQAQCLRAMLPHLPRALARLNTDYADKTLQQALIPRSILLVALPFMAVTTHLINYLLLNSSTPQLLNPLLPLSPLKWWLLLAALAIALFAATPAKLLTSRLLTPKILTFTLPRLVLRMMRNILHIRTDNTDFIHTKHGEQALA